MDLQKRLDAAIRTLDLATKESVHRGGYNFEAADLRDLLVEIRSVWVPTITRTRLELVPDWALAFEKKTS